MRIIRLAAVNPRKHEGLTPFSASRIAYLGPTVKVYRGGKRPLQPGDYVTLNRQVAEEFIDQQNTYVSTGKKFLVEATIPTAHLSHNSSGEMIYTPPGWQP